MLINHCVILKYFLNSLTKLKENSQKKMYVSNYIIRFKLQWTNPIILLRVHSFANYLIVRLTNYAMSRVEELSIATKNSIES